MATETRGTRINWTRRIKESLARETAATLIAWGEDSDFDNRMMMKAFRATMPSVLDASLRRDVGGPSQVPWLRDMVENDIRLQRETPTIELHDPVSLPINTPPASDDETTLHLILDTLTDVQNSQGRQANGLASILNRLAIVEDVMAKFTHTLERLEATILKRRERFARKERLKATMKANIPPPEPVAPEEPPPLRIGVAGLLRPQWETVRNDLKGFGYNIDLSFVDVNIKGPSQIPRFDWLIVTEWAGRDWRNKAVHLNQSRTIVTRRSVKEVSNAVHKVASDTR